MRSILRRWRKQTMVSVLMLPCVAAVVYVGFQARSRIDFLILLFGVAGILVSAVALLLWSARGRKTLRHSLLKILTNQDVFSTILSSKAEMGDGMSQLVATYHSRYGPPDDIKREVAKEIVERLSRPLRENYEVNLSLYPDERGFTSLEKEVRYDQFSYDEPDAFIFGTREFFKTNVEFSPAMKDAGVSPSEVFSFVSLEVNGTILERGRDYEIHQRMADDDVLQLTVASNLRFPDDRDKINVAFRTRSLNQPSDYSVSTMMCVVRSLRVLLSYDERVFETMLFGMVPIDWDEPRTGHLVGTGTRLLEFRNRVLLPGHSALATWRRCS